MFKSFAALTLVAVVLAGCTTTTKESTAEEIQASVFVSGQQPKLTLMTMVNNRSGAGGHSALLVQGSQTVIFDPAGTYIHPRVPERGDVLYGMSPGWLQNYKSAHARSNFHVVSQEFVVTPAQAERALQLVQANGPVQSAMCANTTSALLAQIPGFQSIRQVYFPLKLMQQVAELPGVKTTRYYEDDEGNVSDGIKVLPE